MTISEENKSVGVFTGTPGAGKSSMIRLLEAALDKSAVRAGAGYASSTTIKLPVPSSQ